MRRIGTALVAAVLLSLGACSAQAAAATRDIPDRTRDQLIKVHRLIKRGELARARKVGRRIDKREVPLRRRDRPVRCADSPGKYCKVHAPQSQGCDVAAGEAIYDVDYLGFDAFKPKLSQSFCWENGRITKLGGVGVESGLTVFGSLVNFHYEGVVYSEDRWANFGGRRHGKRIVVRVLRFTGCTSIPGVGGCAFPKTYDVALALVMSGDGPWGFGDSVEE